MTEGFEFEKTGARLEICGQQMLLPIGEQTVRVCSEILAEAKRRLALIKSGKNSDEVSDAEICIFFRQSIERLLGESIADEVLSEVDNNLDGLAELLCCIASAIRKAYEAEAHRRKQEE